MAAKKTSEPPSKWGPKLYKFSIGFALAILAGCGSAPLGATRNLVVQPAVDAVHRASTSGPAIRLVTPIQAEQTQWIAIKGKDFGMKRPYDGDSCCIQFTMTNEKCGNTWQAGKTGELIKLHVKLWIEQKIVVTGFTGDYGQHCWVLNPGDPVIIQVWNAQTKAGPARWRGTVQ
jgi:hypothetical protein